FFSGHTYQQDDGHWCILLADFSETHGAVGAVDLDLLFNVPRRSARRLLMLCEEINDRGTNMLPPGVGLIGRAKPGEPIGKPGGLVLAIGHAIDDVADSPLTIGALAEAIRRYEADAFSILSSEIANLIVFPSPTESHAKAQRQLDSAARQDTGI